MRPIGEPSFVNRTNGEREASRAVSGKQGRATCVYVYNTYVLYTIHITTVYTDKLPPPQSIYYTHAYVYICCIPKYT